MAQCLLGSSSAASDVSVDITAISPASFDDLYSKLTEIVASTNFAVRFITDASTDSFLYDCSYYATIFSRKTTAVAKLINKDSPGQDVLVYGKKTDDSWTWSGPYWTNPPYEDGIEYMLDETFRLGYQVYGMFLSIDLDVGTDTYKVITLSDKIGDYYISVVLDFSYHVDRYLTEFNSINEFIEITYGDQIRIHYTTTGSHTVKLKLKYLKVKKLPA